MEVYGKTGYVICKNGKDMLLMESEKEGAKPLIAKPLPNGIQEPFAFLANVLKQHYVIEPYSLSSLENNEIVVQILEAAKHAAKTGQTVVWDDFFKK
jgi:hypothetical protein